MIVKDIHFKGNKLRSGIRKMTEAVGSTMGPMGNTVLIESENHTGGITTTKDGVTVSRAISLYDPTENLAVMMMRQAADRTATSAGDGTTTAIVLAEAMIRSADELITTENNRTEVTREMSRIADGISESLAFSALPVEGRRLYEVATISSNNDEEMGKLIGEAYESVGKDGMVTVDNSRTTKTYSSITNGIHFDRGVMSIHHITDHKKNIVELERPYILVTDLEIPSFKSVARLLERVVNDNRPLLIIGEVSMDFAATLNRNIVTKKIKGAHVLPPNFGYRREELMQDLATAIGANYITEKTGSDWGLVTVDDLGQADRVIIEKDGTSIINDDDTSDIEGRIEDIRQLMKEDDSEESQEFCRERLAMLSGKVATIYVGGKTDIEQKERRDRVDDAVLATRAALEGGILSGGGIALLDSGNFSIDSVGDDCLVAASIMERAIEAPFRQILKNASLDPDEIRSSGRVGEGWGYDPKKGSYGDMIEMGIIDPAKVTRSALINATSVATTILMTSAIITNIREGESIEPELTKSTGSTDELSILWGLYKHIRK